MSAGALSDMRARGSGCVRKRWAEVASLGLASLSMIGSAWAEDLCARASDLVALQVAAVQQELMVAGLSCRQDGLYNTFVVTYRKELQDSDATLQAYFLRFSTPAEYDAYKTRLANRSSLRSTYDKRAFCDLTRSIFRAALNEGQKSLAEFALAQPVSIDETQPACGERVAGGAMVAALPAPFPTPSPAPGLDYDREPEHSFDNGAPSYREPERTLDDSAPSYRDRGYGPPPRLRYRRYDPRERYRVPDDPYWDAPEPGPYWRRR